MIEKQIINLEIKFSHLEDFAQKLSEVITLQQVTMERLEKEILDLKRALGSGGEVQGSRRLEDERPPHY